MADKKLTALAEMTNPLAAADWLHLVDADDLTDDPAGSSRKLGAAELVWGDGTPVTITGGGTIALGGYNLTAPASGTVALLATANSFVAVQTFNDDTVVANGKKLQWKDSGGTTRPVLQLWTDNNVYIDNQAGGQLVFRAGATVWGGWDASGNFRIGDITATAKLDIASDVLRLRTAKTPASAAAAGNRGDICTDANYIYVCTATNAWKRAAIASW